MKIFASNLTFYLPKFSPLKPKFPAFCPRTTEKFNYPLSTLKPHANAVGREVTSKKPNKGKNNEDEEIPQVVFNRMIVRTLVSVGVPMALGLAYLQIFGELKEQQVWDVPLWIPFLTNFPDTVHKFGCREETYTTKLRIKKSIGNSG